MLMSACHLVCLQPEGSRSGSGEVAGGTPGLGSESAELRRTEDHRPTRWADSQG